MKKIFSTRKRLIFPGYFNNEETHCFRSCLLVLLILLGAGLFVCDFFKVCNIEQKKKPWLRNQRLGLDLAPLALRSWPWDRQSLSTVPDPALGSQRPLVQ